VLKKKLLKTAFTIGGFNPFHMVNRKKLLVLTYHRFSEAIHPGRISAAEFRSHLNYLRKRVTVISLPEAICSISGERRLPPNATVITIDDGYNDAFKIALPILKEFQFPATLFVVTNFVNGGSWIWTDYIRYILLAQVTKKFEWRDKMYDLGGMALTSKLHLADQINSQLKELFVHERNQCISDLAEQVSVAVPDLPPSDYSATTVEQLREMDSSGLQIESHTVTHPILTKIAHGDLKAELKDSQLYLENVLDRKVQYFCYPNGNVNDEVRKAVVETGYAAAVTTQFGLNEARSDRFMLRRIDSPASIDSFAQYTSGFESFRQNIKAL
jgi:peptidoglycan/xylan/chitin deacetylase (PgdA/CDA1 family)